MTAQKTIQPFDSLKKRVRLAKLFAATIDKGNIHLLKTVDPFFQDVWYDFKTAEIRFNDRNFQCNDTLILVEYKPPNFSKDIPESYTGRFVIVTVTNIVSSDQFEGLAPGYSLLSFRKISQGTIENIEEIVNPEKFEQTSEKEEIAP